MDNSDIAEIKHDVKHLLQQGSVHNELLRQHEARSLALQQEQKLQASLIEPIVRHVDFVNSVGKGSLAVIVGVLIAVLGKVALIALHLI